MYPPLATMPATLFRPFKAVVAVVQLVGVPPGPNTHLLTLFAETARPMGAFNPEATYNHWP